jgi:hypothetical protein
MVPRVLRSFLLSAMRTEKQLSSPLEIMPMSRTLAPQRNSEVGTCMLGLRGWPSHPNRCRMTTTSRTRLPAGLTTLRAEACLDLRYGDNKSAA